MPEHRVGEGREVDVVAKEFFRRDGFGDLDERALRAEREVEREMSVFGLLRVVGREQGVG